jgi:hypothetical protein
MCPRLGAVSKIYTRRSFDRTKNIPNAARAAFWRKRILALAKWASLYGIYDIYSKQRDQAIRFSNDEWDCSENTRVAPSPNLFCTKSLDHKESGLSGEWLRLHLESDKGKRSTVKDANENQIVLLPKKKDSEMGC